MKCEKSKCKSYSYFFSKNISIYAMFNDQSFNDTLTNDIVSFEQLGPGKYPKTLTNLLSCFREFCITDKHSGTLRQFA